MPAEAAQLHLFSAELMQGVARLGVHVSSASMLRRGGATTAAGTTGGPATWPACLSPSAATQARSSETRSPSITRACHVGRSGSR
jgi:hypothetical protein